MTAAEPLAVAKAALIVLHFAACPLPEDPHWALGHWAVGSWGGIEIRPDHLVVEVNADGGITDAGRWTPLGDDAIVVTSAAAPWREIIMSRDSSGRVTYVRDFGGGVHGEPVEIKCGHLPEEFEAYEVAF